MGGLIVIQGAVLECSKGNQPSLLATSAGATVTAGPACMPVASVFDHRAFVNVRPFGVCRHGKPRPCAPITPAPWTGGMTGTLLGVQPMLPADAQLICAIGGTIRVTQPGQTTVTVDDIVDTAPDDDDDGGLLGTLHNLLDVAGFIPGAGAIPDGVNALIYTAEGDWENVGWSVLGAIPLGGDAAKGLKMTQKAAKKTATETAQHAPKYVPSPKHKPGGHGTPMDLDDANAAKVLKNSVQSGKQRYGYKDGKAYEFQPDNTDGHHGYPVPGNEVPNDVLRKWRDDGTITKPEYNKLRKGKK